jgi:hypothetical protein
MAEHTDLIFEIVSGSAITEQQVALDDHPGIAALAMRPHPGDEFKNSADGWYWQHRLTGRFGDFGMRQGPLVGPFRSEHQARADCTLRSRMHGARRLRHRDEVHDV